MAVKLGSSLGGAKAQNWEDNSEINVTPFVDVMLVLLIIFMVAAPLAAVNVKVDLPPSNAEATPNPPDPVYVSIQENGRVFLGDYETDLGRLGLEIERRTGGNRDNRILIRADGGAVYGYVMRAMNVLQDHGYFKVALVAEDKD